jgi:thymidylate synthase
MNYDPLMENTGNPAENAYLAMLSNIMEKGVDKSDRTGVGTREVFGNLLRIDMRDGTFPLLTTKQVFWKTAFKEMLWMLSGSTNIRPLLLENVTIWSEWPHAKYVRKTGDDIDIKTFENRIIEDEHFARIWGDTGGAYGVQWRNWPTYERIEGTDTFRAGPGHDQIQEVIDTLKNSPDSRRIRFTAWNAPHLKQMMLPPCHSEYQFQVEEDRLNLALTIRSWDTFLGGPFNIANAGLLLHMMAEHTGFKIGELAIFSVCTHIYHNHFGPVTSQLSRTPGEAPRLIMNKRGSFFDQTIDDFEMVGYKHQGKIEAPVAV